MLAIATRAIVVVVRVSTGVAPEEPLLEILDLGGALFGGRLTTDAPCLRSDALALAAHQRAIDSEYFHDQVGKAAKQTLALLQGPTIQHRKFKVGCLLRRSADQRAGRRTPRWRINVKK